METTLFTESPFAFSRYKGDYRVFVEEISLNLGVDIKDIKLAGSGSLGFSLNPSHLPSSFKSNSDLDVVVASSDVFCRAWIDILNLAGSTVLLDPKEKHLWNKSRDNIADGFIRPDQMPLSSMLVREWFPRISGPYRSIIASQHEVTAWLFFSIEHAVIFYSRCLQKVQPELARIISKEGGAT